jgi:hypothetical protein
VGGGGRGEIEIFFFGGGGAVKWHRAEKRVPFGAQKGDTKNT